MKIAWNQNNKRKLTGAEIYILKRDQKAQINIVLRRREIKCEAVKRKSDRGPDVRLSILSFGFHSCSVNNFTTIILLILDLKEFFFLTFDEMPIVKEEGNAMSVKLPASEKFSQ